MSFLENIFEISKHYKSFYLLDIDRFDNDLHLLLDEFKTYYTNTKLAYSFKTNYIPDLCLHVKEKGMYAEVVSEMEYEYAVHLGFEKQSIIYNGPNKSSKSLQDAVCNGSIVNIDSFGELKGIKKIIDNNIQENSNKVQLALRLNFSDYKSRFGIDEEILPLVMNYISKHNMKIVGLHCHIMPENKSHFHYEIITQKVLSVYQKYFINNGDFDFINMGGGFISDMPISLKKQLSFEPSTFKDYSRAIALTFSDFFKNKDNTPQLIIEPGLSVVANCLRFYSKVLNVKKGLNVVICDGSIYNIKPTKNKLNLPTIKVSHSNGFDDEEKEYTVTGSTCMEDDIMYTGKFKGLKVGDILEFSNVGAYSVVLYPPFIVPQKAIFKIEDEKNVMIRNESDGKAIFIDYKKY